MIFQYTWQKVLSGEKTQTRRLVKSEHMISAANTCLFTLHPDYRIFCEVGRTYAVQTGRGRKAIGRIHITAIRQERLQDISEDDARAEGCQTWTSPTLEIANTPCQEYAWLWNEIHTKSGTRWDDNPLVWVLEFELAKPLNLLTSP